MTVAELGRRMSSAEVSEWMAYLSLEDRAALHGALADRATAALTTRRSTGRRR